MSLIGLSDADIAIFGGDLNAAPIENQHHPYGMMRSVMKDSLTEKFPSASLHPAFATFGNADNTYTHNSIPERIDYLMFRAKSHIDMKVGLCMYLYLGNLGKFILGSGLQYAPVHDDDNRGLCCVPVRPRGTSRRLRD